MRLRGPWPRRALTLAIGLVGAAVFHFAALPLPWLLGSLTACILAAFAGAPLAGPGPVAPVMRTVLGVAIGASITPAFFAHAGEFLVSLALVPVSLLLIAAIGIPFFRLLWRFDWVTAFYAAMPGGFQDMLVFGEAAGANMHALALVHATRVAAIVIAAPMVMKLYFDLDFTLAGAEGPDPSPWWELLLMAFCAILGWKVAQRIGLFGATIIGPMILTAGFTLTGVITHRPPMEAIILAQLSIGLGVGARYVGVTWEEFRRLILAGAAYALVITGVATGFAILVAEWTSADPAAALLAFAPGGQAEIAIMAIAAGVDAAFVIAHHLFRIVLVIFGAPLAMRVMGRGR